MGILLLEGGSEFQGKMEEADRKALALAGGGEAKIAIIPTAAAPGNNSKLAGDNALKWFRKLGVVYAISLPIVDKKAADDPALSAELKRANFIFILGGFPGYLENTLRDSRCLDALLGAYNKGAVLAGSSAGAMVLFEWYFDPAVKKIKKGFGIQNGVILIPHHNRVGNKWRSLYFDKVADVLWVGIDEQTGMINQTEPNSWTVHGKGGVTVYGRTAIDFFRSGQTFRL
jgi:cyanophycinase